VIKLEIRKVDDATVIVIPEEIASQLCWEPGDECAGEIDGDTLRVVRAETKHEQAMKIARRGMEKYRDTIEKLAKS
jgi:bifunctional DNA-binding transcriptional regulator/antitoxin component of YhaV-PrlF toxin-antitoxin module